MKVVAHTEKESDIRQACAAVAVRNDVRRRCARWRGSRAVARRGQQMTLQDVHGSGDFLQRWCDERLVDHGGVEQNWVAKVE